MLSSQHARGSRVWMQTETQFQNLEQEHGVAKREREVVQHTNQETLQEVTLRTETDVELAWKEKVKSGEIDMEKIKKKEPNIFQVPLAAYPMQPWQRAVQQLKRGTPQDVTTAMQNLQQWFNYDMTPGSWEQYAQQQNEMAGKCLQ